MTKVKNHDHDHPLKLIFSHSVMIESLIKGFVPEPWVLDLDFDSLIKDNVEHTTDDLRSRENDIIWKIDFKGMPLYLICLLEFQSEMEHVPILEPEQARKLSDINCVLGKLVKMLKSPEFKPLRQDFSAYIKNATKLHEKYPDVEFNELHEVSVMLSERLARSEKELEQIAHQKGRTQILIRLFEKRFGNVTPGMKQRLESAKDNELDRILDQILSNEHEEVF